MPMAAPSVCSCGKLVRAGVRCSCKLVSDRERAAATDKRRSSSNARGYDSKWRTARIGFLKHHPKCAMCSSPANVVDHKIPHRGDKTLFWDKTNWQPLCQPCHDRTKQSQERRGQP